MDQLDIYWKKTLDIYKNKVEDKIIYDSYYAPLKIKNVIDDDIIVTVETKWNYEEIISHKADLEEIFNTISNGFYHLVFMTEEDYIIRHDVKDELFDYEDNLNDELTFESFVVGKSNNIAQNASLTVAMKPGVSFSPLFIHSQSGMGKTHLLNAIGNYAKKRNPSLKILYTSSENFVSEYIKSIKDNTVDDFNFKYRHIDILLIDDIQFLATKEASSEVLFNIFNELKRNKKQIVITSDQPPRELKGMEARLVSRFTQGLTVSIDTPEFETATAILRKKIELENVEIPIADEVIDFMATHYTTDVRELEGSLKRLLFYKLIFGKKLKRIDLDFALEAFADTYTAPKEKKELTVDVIKKVVADYYNLTVAQINSKSRTSNIIIARHIAMYLVRNLIKDISFIQIGHEFGGRDHSTVMKACDKVSKNIKKDKNYKKAVDELKNKLL